MLENEKQRRWWFANHPEYSSSRKGERNNQDNDGHDAGEKVTPESVDAYVDEALKYLDGPEAALLKSFKRNFGTQAETKGSNHKFAFSRDPGYQSTDEVSPNQQKDQKEPTFRDALLRGFDDTIQSWKRFLGLSARLPPKGTPERRAIEAARKRGIDRKRAEELKDIKAGGKGSGVWTEEELEGIGKTGEWPDDAVWHHDPTVANRPDLAADPRSVHIIRGGTKAHLWKGHRGNYQNPRIDVPKKDSPPID